MDKKTIGSGYFGEWIEDEFGQPAYRYTCNQTDDPRAVSPVNPVWRAPTDHSHQIGNDRLVAVVSNYGYVQVRQDEGSPKFLNDFSPQKNQYAGGFGYLSDGQNVLSTFYTGRESRFERIFGTGYFKKTVRKNGYKAVQTLFVPFGDEPLLISRIELTNKNSSRGVMRWIEYWGNLMYQFSFRAMLMSAITGDFSGTAAIRRRMAEAFNIRIENMANGRGLFSQSEFNGWSEQDEQMWSIIESAMASSASDLLASPPEHLSPEASYDDLNPSPVFLVSLDGPIEGLETDAAHFFGAGGAENPDGLHLPFSRQVTVPDGGALLLERNFDLKPGETRSFNFAYGYLPESRNMEELLSAYGSDLSSLLEDTCKAWQEDRILFSVPAEPWVEREMKWHNYYLGSNLTYDDFFREHILSQGHVYQYIMGFQGAARDQLQHALPFIYNRPWIARETIRYTLKEVYPDGDIPYGVVGHGMIMPVAFKPSDSVLWLLWFVSEYVLATRDSLLMKEKIIPLHTGGKPQAEESVKEILHRCYNYLLNGIGCGAHGLLRLSNGDWNDSVVIGHAESEQHELIREQAETVLNSAMASYVLDLYAQLLAFIGESEMAEEAAEKATGLREAVRNHWNGCWFKRAWLGSGLGWIGDDELWLEPQPWAIIGRVMDRAHAATLLEHIDRLLREPSRIGAMLFSRGLKRMEEVGGVKAGVLTNGGVWASINGTLIWALSLLDGNMAWDEWRKNTLCHHAEEYPEVWYGIWSGPDTYNSALSEHHGQTQFDESLLDNRKEQGGEFKYKGINWTDFPVMNMHQHAWPLYSVLKLVGLEFKPDGLELSPRLPMEDYDLSSPLLGFSRSKGDFAGWYAPLQTGDWSISIYLPVDEIDRITVVTVNGKEVLVDLQDGAVKLKGRGGREEPLRWELRLEKRQ